MSSEALDRTVVTQTRCTDPTQYWVFFPTDNGAFWHFGARRQEDVQTQKTSSQHTALAHNNISWHRG
jgi:hypothetical protein